MGSDVSDVEDAFAVLASSLRLEILRALHEEHEQSPHSFTELYELVDTSNTSQFSYHLNELADRYVHRTEEGYVVSDTGRRIVRSVDAGTFTFDPEFEPVTVPTHCPYCEATSAEATYDGQLATVDCLSCENTLLRYDLRPAHVMDRSAFGALKAADRGTRAELGSALRGVCQSCGGSVETDVLTGSDAEPAAALVVCDCRQCGQTLSAPVEIALLHHRDVIARYRGERVTALSTPTWKLLPELATWTVEPNEGASVTVVVPGDEQLRLDVPRNRRSRAGLLDEVTASKHPQTR